MTIGRGHTRTLIVLLMVSGCAYASAANATPLGPDPQKSRFLIVEKAQLVRDSHTGLVWQRAQSPESTSWKGTFDYCESLKLEDDVVFEWRLPTLKELLTLVVPPKDSSFAHIDGGAFPDTPPEFFWTSSANDSDVAAVFFVMSRFPPNTESKAFGRTRCVSGAMKGDAIASPDSTYYLITIPRGIAD